uniref:Uncharacterized protein n=1 Tax=Podoviridae sp. ct2m58 TaxID=2827721 RepID=A0A8S5TLX8_9CAUD|nr:MAG TPA: hypothetical protein [Podoviridae sp. ct2m58]
MITTLSHIIYGLFNYIRLVLISVIGFILTMPMYRYYLHDDMYL